MQPDCLTDPAQQPTGKGQSISPWNSVRKLRSEEEVADN
jgi:hypothetical protein